MRSRITENDALSTRQNVQKRIEKDVSRERMFHEKGSIREKFS